MTDRDALLRAVCDNPDDDLPRLVFADWLDEHGEPDRAEFIRVQIALAGRPTVDRRERLEAREQVLIHEHGQAWLEQLGELVNDDFTLPKLADYFRRGFVEKLPLLAETLTENGDTLFAATPIREVWLPDEEQFDPLAKCRHTLRLRLLDLTMSGLSDNFNPAVLFRSPNLANLTSLIAQGYDDNCHLDIAGIRGITASTYLSGLKRLDVSNNWFGEEGTEAVLKAKNLRSLEVLEFEGVGMEDGGAVRVAETRWLRQLKELSLVANGIGNRGARALLESPHLEGIQVLDLRDNRTTQPDDDELDEIGPAISRDTLEDLRARFGGRVLL